jgi:hypothetical protein
MRMLQDFLTDRIFSPVRIQQEHVISYSMLSLDDLRSTFSNQFLAEYLFAK